jgi:hypothetical protein
VGNLQYPDLKLDVEAYVDTGFDGGLIVPAGLIPDRIRVVGETVCILADGSIVRARFYVGFVSVGTLPPVDTVIMTLPGRTLLGLAVTNRYRLSFLRGRQVVLES